MATKFSLISIREQPLAWDTIRKTSLAGNTDAGYGWETEYVNAVKSFAAGSERLHLSGSDTKPKTHRTLTVDEIDSMLHSLSPEHQANITAAALVILGQAGPPSTNSLY
jgi:hypothetical protein